MTIPHQAPRGAGSAIAALVATAAAAALALATFNDGASLLTRLVTLALACAAYMAGWLRPAAATVALLAAAPLLPALPRFLGDPKGGPALLVIAVAGLGAAASRRIRDGEASPLPDRLWRWSLAFLAVAGVSALSSIVRGETLYLLLRGGASPLFVNGLWMSAPDRARDAVRAFLAFGLLLLALDAFARLAREERQRQRLLLALALGSLAAFVVVLLEPRLPFTLTIDPWIYFRRRTGSFSDPNALGIGLALMTPLLLVGAVLRRHSTALRWTSIAALALIPFALNVSGSRSGLLLLSVAAAAAGAGLLRTRPSLRVPFLAVVVLAALGAAAVYRFQPRGVPAARGALLQRIASVFSTGSLNDISSRRPIFWRTALEVMRDEPLTGCGLGGFPFEFPVRYEKRHGPVDVTDNATNALLDLGAECGIPALLLALGAAVPLLMRAASAAVSRDAEPLARAGGAALVGFAVASLAGSHIRFPEVALLVALAAAFVPPIAETSAEESETPPLRRVRLVLAASGILAALLVLIPTLRPEAPFRAGQWIGVYRWEEWKGVAQRWMGPRVFRQIQPGEKSLGIVMVNRRPDSRPVLVSADIDGRLVQRLTIPSGAERPLVIDPVPDGSRVLRLRFEPSFTPFRVTGKRDFRELAVVLVWDNGEPH